MFRNEGQVPAAAVQNARTAIVTGASRGIGQYIARTLAAEGYRLMLTGRAEHELRRLADTLEAEGRNVAVAAADLCDPDGPARVVGAAQDRFGAVDVLVNNAAYEPQMRFHTLRASEIDGILRVNLVAPIQLTHLLLPGMLDRGFGRIVNISSLAGRTGFPFTEAYAAAKDGLIAFSRVLRSDYRGTGVSASSVILAAVSLAGLTQRTLDETGLKTSTAFFVKPEQVARAVLRAIEKDKPELVVARGPGRLIKAIIDLFPGFGPSINRLSGIERLMSSVADHREEQRASSRLTALNEAS